MLFYRFGDGNMTLDHKIREKLLEDHKIAQKAVHERLKDGRNAFVVKEHYLSPSCIFRHDLPLEDERGELRYFTRIRQALESALTTGSIPRELWLPYICPDYLAALKAR